MQPQYPVLTRSTSEGFSVAPTASAKEAIILAPLSAETVLGLFEAVRSYGTALWVDATQAGRIPDGRQAWQPLKAIAARSEGTGAWKGLLSNQKPSSGEGLGPSALEILEEIEFGGGLRGQQAHFYAQLLRIPLREGCDLRRVLQIAYNLGQLAGSGALQALGSTWLKRYVEWGLGRPETYLADFGGFRAHATISAEIVEIFDELVSGQRPSR
jgi:hypothetical protein